MKLTVSRFRLISAALGVIGSAGTIAAMWLPLAKLAGLGPVGPFDYSRERVYACIGAAIVIAVGSLVGTYRIALLFAGLLCGLLTATGIDLYQALRDAVNTSNGDTSQMARQMIANSSLQSGAYILPLCCLICVAAAILGGQPKKIATFTSES